MLLSDLTKVMVDDSASIYKKALYVLLYELGIELDKGHMILISNVTSCELLDAEIKVIEKALNNED